MIKQKFPWEELIGQDNRLNMFVNGKWITAESNEWDPVYDPSTKNVIGYVPQGGKVEAELAVDSASKAFPLWSVKSGRERSKYLFRLANLLRKELLPIASLLSAESGKTLQEAIGEVRSAIAYISWYTEEAKRIYGTVIPPADSDKRIFVIKQPVGVVASICPFNFPFGIIARKLAASVAAGCTYVAKPAPDTPLSAIILAQLVKTAGFPDGVINIITGNAEEIGNVFCEHPAVRKITFTGSTNVGRHLAAKAASNLKQTQMELGGNSPCIIFPDIDQEKILDSLLYAKFRNAGQICGSPNRIYVHESIAAEFFDRFMQKINKLKVGPSHHEESTVGPLINQRAVEKVDRLVSDAIKKGAKTYVCGDVVNDVDLSDGYYYRPTLIWNANEEMDICNEETFGPVGTFLTFKDEVEVIKRATATPYGLMAFVYSQDITRVLRISEKLEVGNVGVNGAVSAYIESPFGGVKNSGWGREGGQEGINDFLESVTVAIQL
ncbi:NAD-dependent succinate-semialdehyde dehydrogenase [Bacillus sp. JJ1533]|uniref:NAD-dependent succinate-semialdehyde dehydrogenase n=1 Tax=Bacillus sp. JJ1533 TaxID=3122959 RepID=UPI003000710F